MVLNFIFCVLIKIAEIAEIAALGIKHSQEKKIYYALSVLV